MNKKKVTSIKDIIAEIRFLKSQKENLIIAVDGPCSGGKTTLASYLARIFDADVVHMDDFFLPADLRTEERYNTPGGNVHYERFLLEVLKPLSENKQYTYITFNCRAMSFSEPITRTPEAITIVEGSYSCHPFLSEYYDLKIFIDIDSAIQRERILLRNGAEKLRDYENKWIPFENTYFEEYDIKGDADIIIDSKEWFYE